MRKWTDEEIRNYRKEHHQLAIYFNPKDARIVVPKYIGIGITINFGHKSTLFAGIIIIAIIVVSIFL